MMIKHWQGYGRLNAKVKKAGCTYNQGFTDRYVVIEVVGNHEWGLELPYDNYRLAEWLGKLGKFTKEEIKDYTTESFYDDNGIEHCIYTVSLKDKR